MLVVTLKHEEEGRRVQDDSITIELGMPELRVEGCREVDGGYVVTVRYRAMTRACPRCGRETSHVHQYHRQLKVHTPVWGRRVVLEFRKRRFRCEACGRVFMEPDEVCGARRRSTKKFRAELAAWCGGSSVKGIAAWAGVSEGLVRRAFEEAGPAMISVSAHPPGVVALDELWLGARVGYVTLMYAPEQQRVLGLCRGRTQAVAEKLLMGLGEDARVRAVVMDMSETYRQAVHYACPGAVIIADKFHVISRVLKELGRVVSRVQSGAPPRDARALRRRRLFSAPTALLSEEDIRQRDRLLATYPDLKQAWEAVQGFRAVYAAAGRPEAARLLEAWWQKVRRSGPREFRGLSHMLTHWYHEILNYFLYRVTNGFAEGKNNRIKAIIRAGYGYRNIDNLTRRIMLANPSQPAARVACSPHFLT